MAPEIILGSGLYGHSLDEVGIRRQLTEAAETGLQRIDSGAHHPYSNPGIGEKLLGKIGFQDQGFIIDSKVMYTNGGNGNLTGEGVRKSLDETLEKLKIKLNVYYALAPDRQTPLEEQAAAFDVQYRLGKFSHLGLCNFQPDMVEEWIKIADAKGYVKPTVFQGQYNLLCRGYEANLFPLLRKHNMSFNAFAVLAGGMLTGKVTFAKGPEELKGTRFEVSESNFIGSFGRKWYDKKSFHDAISKMARLCEPHGLSIADASLRWAMNHSSLSGDLGDGIIVGCQNKKQLDQNLTGLRGGPLPSELVEALNGLWDGVKDDAAEILVY